MSENGKFEEQQEKIVKTLATMFDYLGLTGTFRVEEKGTKIAVKIASEDAGRIIGRKGQTLDFPDLGDRVADKLYSGRMSIRKALTELPIGDRAELRRWKIACAEMFRKALNVEE